MTDAIRTKKRWDEEEEAKRRRNIGDCKEGKGSRGSRDDIVQMELSCSLLYAGNTGT